MQGVFNAFWQVLAALAVVATAHAARAQDNTIQWEITNRFAPFEVLSDPEAYFQAYSLKPGETWRMWHERKWREAGPAFTSPYAQALLAGAPVPWDENLQGHVRDLTDFVQHEDDPGTTVSVRLWVDDDRRCVWNTGGLLTARDHCREPLSLRVPLAGRYVSVHFPAQNGLAPRLSAGLRVKPEHMVIVGLGDSYGTGEGNPDLPAQWRPGLAPSGPDVSWLVVNYNIKRRPRWVSPRCHRSFFSQQNLTALGLASQDPHRFVSFLHYACSGAEVFNGLLNPQEDPPGGDGFNRYSQINAVRRDLCRDTGTRPTYHAVPADVLAGASVADFHRRNGVALRPGSNLDWRMRRSEGGGDTFPREGILDCADGALRAPDLVLLSIGGNDVGFGELVHYFVAPLATTSSTGTSLILPKLCPAPPYRADPSYAPHAPSYCARLDRTIGYHAGDLIGRHGDKGGVGARLGLTTRIVRHGLQVDPNRIVMAHYPDPLRRSETSTDACWHVARPPDVQGAPVTDPQSPWNGLKSADPTGFFRDNEFTLVEDEARKLLFQFDDLRFQITLFSRLSGVKLACGSRDAMVGRGWWAGRHLVLPSDSAGSDRWAPWQWHPYRFEESGRTVRTGNDSVLTQADGTVSLDGTAHPNLAGHTLIADQVLKMLADPANGARALPPLTGRFPQ